SDREVKLDPRQPRRAAMGEHLDLPAAGQETRTRLPPAIVARRLLDEERAVDAVRAADLADANPHRRDSSDAIASSRDTVSKRFSATNACACGQPLARVSRTARSTSNGVRIGFGSPFSTSVQYAATSPS